MNTQRQLLDISPLHNPGGKVRLPVPASWESEAVFSPCQKYRYEPSRIWRPGPKAKLVLFVMQNPSVATREFNDPTIAKCCRFADKWGYDGVLVGNICAYRATDKRNLPRDPAEALGPENHTHLLLMARRSNLIVMAHGQLPDHLKIFSFATRLYLEMYAFKLHALKLAKDGAPVHPLYLKEDLTPLLWGLKR